MRSDNLCFVGGRAVLVDWNWASLANPALDVAAWLPSLRVEGGPQPWEVLPDAGRWRRSSRASGRRSSACRRPRPRRRVRALQRAQLAVALDWIDRDCSENCFLAETVGERLELGRVQSDLAGLERGLHLARELECFARLVRVEHRRDAREYRVPFVQLDVDGRQRAACRRCRGRRGRRPRPSTVPPPGREACSTTGDRAQAHARNRNNVRPHGDAPTVTPRERLERVVDFRPRTVFRVLLIVLAVAVTLEVIWIARHVLAWVVIALFLALALDPLVGWIERRSRLDRGAAIGVAYLACC